MILELISTILLGLALLYFIGQSIYYYNKIHKLEKRIEVFEKHLVVDENNDVWLKVEKDYTGYVKVEGIKWDELRKELENDK